MPVLDWIGKKAVVNHHREVPYRLIHSNGALSVSDPVPSGNPRACTQIDHVADNLLVQGDNLEALKALLPYYAGRVKCIYIDPPYNTGNEGWVYNDNVNSPEILAWLGKVVGRESEDLSRHDKWLCMMYPRLRLLREFLREDGAIFVSIDDNEGHYLKALMDEIFGRKNFIANALWQKRTSPDARIDMGDAHDHILVFARDAERLSLNMLPSGEKQRATYKNPDNDPRGPWASTDFTAQGWRPNQMYPITAPGGRVFSPPEGRCWKNVESRFLELNADGRIWWGKNGNSQPRRKTFFSESAGVRSWTWWSKDEVGHNQEAKKEVIALLGATDAFATPKPVRLIQRILQIATGPDDLVLDSFAGSGTTGHAVLDLNKHQEDSNRRFILVEMDEDIATRITAERLRRVIGGYDKGGDSAKPVKGLGGSFQYCRMGTPLFDEDGDIDSSVTFPDLATHIFFSETGSPLPQQVDGSTSLIGQNTEKAVYLLFSAHEHGHPLEAASNVLTPDVLAALPSPTPEGADEFAGTRVVYADGSTVSPERLRTEGVIFKQIPYEIEGN